MEFRYAEEELGDVKLAGSSQHFIKQRAQLPDCGGAGLACPQEEKLWRQVCFGSFNKQTDRWKEDLNESYHSRDQQMDKEQKPDVVPVKLWHLSFKKQPHPKSMNRT